VLIQLWCKSVHCRSKAVKLLRWRRAATVSRHASPTGQIQMATKKMRPRKSPLPDAIQPTRMSAIDQVMTANPVMITKPRLDLRTAPRSTSRTPESRCVPSTCTSAFTRLCLCVNSRVLPRRAEALPVKFPDLRALRKRRWMTSHFRPISSHRMPNGRKTGAHRPVEPFVTIANEQAAATYSRPQSVEPTAVVAPRLSATRSSRGSPVGVAVTSALHAMRRLAKRTSCKERASGSSGRSASSSGRSRVTWSNLSSQVNRNTHQFSHFSSVAFRTPNGVLWRLGCRS